MAVSGDGASNPISVGHHCVDHWGDCQATAVWCW